MDLEKAKPLIQACLNNAEGLLNAAKETRKPGSLHISYHLAALSLEEIGKASMIVVSCLPEVTLDDAVKMKTFCDAYFLIHARQEAKEGLAKSQRANSDHTH